MKPNMTLLVCGGRWFNREIELRSVLDRLHTKFTIAALVQGDCETGADAMAVLWAAANNVYCPRNWPANWRLYGNMAGLYRNSRMLREGCPDAGLAFPGGTGTADMTAKMLNAGLTVLVGKFEQPAWEESPIRWELIDGKQPL